MLLGLESFAASQKRYGSQHDQFCSKIRSKNSQSNNDPIPPFLVLSLVSKI